MIYAVREIRKERTHACTTYTEHTPETDTQISDPTYTHMKIRTGNKTKEIKKNNNEIKRSGR